MSANKIPTVPELDQRIRKKYQEKTLSANVTGVTTETTITDLTFNNLTIGNRYKVTFVGYPQSNSTDAATSMFIRHDGNMLRRHVFRDDDQTTQRIEVSFEITAVFTATASSVEFSFAGENGTTWSMNSNGGQGRTFSRIEEWDDYEEVTDFT